MKQPKFNIDDQVYCLINNNLSYISVKCIFIDYDTQEYRYSLFHPFEDPLNGHIIKDVITDDKLFKTKQELLDSL